MWDGQTLVEVFMASTKLSLIELALDDGRNQQDTEGGLVVDVPFFEELICDFLLPLSFCNCWIDIGHKEAVVITNTDGANSFFFSAFIGR